jgi:hypothetical protein
MAARLWRRRFPEYLERRKTDHARQLSAYAEAVVATLERFQSATLSGGSWYPVAAGCRGEQDQASTDRPLARPSRSAQIPGRTASRHQADAESDAR